MNFDVKEIVSATMVLFAVVDIIGSVPIIINLRKKAGRIQSEKTAIVAGILLILFLFIGKQLLNLFGVTVEAFAVAGAFILFFLALEMILGITLYKGTTPETASIVPLAFPMVAGAGALTTVLSLRAKFYVENIIVAILINMIIVYVVLKSSEKIEKFLGKQGITVIHNLFGVILLAIAVNLFTTNIRAMLFGQ
ncbi:MarC family protein [Capnocytophaga ochracea]|jgi:multiple antibiotic resistance (marC)-related protein|uniref:MarC family protein n=1 Tax=Capnocytophaga TaxID=1016 RepID=UPI00026F279D|nr:MULTISPECIES: MarC family protein [Capnocytophaga]EJF37643.1 membrane protein, MarC family [Capnocytophaga sp. oral taxon 335 str. F0486]MEB3017027.1 MarC family protein [Capnocytophaga ochracea]